MGPSNSDSSVTRPQEALTSAWVEAQMRVPAQSRAMPNVFNAGNVVKQLIWTRVITGTEMKTVELKSWAQFSKQLGYIRRARERLQTAKKRAFDVPLFRGS